MDKQVVISVKTVFFTLLMLLGAYIFYRLAGILSILLIALILVISVEPLVQFFMRKTLFNKLLSRSTSVIISYALLIFTLIIAFTIVLPPVYLQARKLLENLGPVATGFLSWIQEFLQSFGYPISVSEFTPQIPSLFSSVSGGFFTFTISVFSVVLTLLTIFMLSIYMSLDWENIKNRFLSLFPETHLQTVEDILSRVELSVGQWVKGQLFLMTTIGVVSSLGLTLLQVPYPLALGLIAGILEIVPILGPVISAVIAAVIAFAESPLKGFAVLALFFIIQQLENNILVPKVMQKVSGFSPLVILIALLVGSNFFGIVGAILSVPLTMIAVIIIKRVLGFSSTGSE